MKPYGAWVALGFLCIGAIGAAAACSWNPLEPPTYDEAKQDPSGSGGGGGIGPGAGGTGGGPACGNGKGEAGEVCDDGNQTDGDGCTATCQIEECWFCSLGSCMPLSAKISCNNGAHVCDGKGGCVDCVPADMACDQCKNCGGYECDEVDDCASAACVTGVCRSANGSPCSDAVECASGSCQGGSPSVCAECANNSQCPSGSCLITGRCLAALGQPCDGSMTCAPGLECSIMNICKAINGALCTGDSHCLSNRCANGACAVCTNNMECSTGTCVNGGCSAVALSDGAYCVDAKDCASNNCTGFPRRCAP